MNPRTQDALGRKAGRFDPSEPLHMTTRHAAKKGRSNGTPSINSSVEDNESRRGSLDGVRPTTAHSLVSQSSPKGRRVSGESANSATDFNLSLDAHMSTSRRVTKSASNPPKSPPQQVDLQTLQSPTRKRKRTHTPPLIGTDNATSSNSAILLHATEEDLDSFRDVVVVVPEDHLSDRESASFSSGRDAEHYMGATQSTEITPAATPIGSEPVSPVSEDTNPTPRYSGKHIDVVMADADNPAGDEEADDIDEDDAPATADDVDDIADPDEDEEDQEDQVTTGRRKRLTGRRRADHHETDIEATMRRQLQLKSAYRSIARALKPLLAEIASKTVEELESNPAMHQQVIEYEGTEEHDGVQKLLNQALADRKRQLDAQVKHNREQLKERFTAEKEVRKGLYVYEVDNMRQKGIDDAEYELLNLVRRIQTEQGKSQEVTDDEDGEVLPRPKHVGYRFTRGGPIDPRHESRSRVALETERAIVDMQRRFEMHQMIQDAREKDDVLEDESFTVMDSTAREAAAVRREGVQSTGLLAAAATEVDRMANIPIIPNEEAVGLQLLGELASRPSLGAIPPTTTTRRLGDPFMSTDEQTQMRPPQNFAVHQALPHMSPGTTQFIERSLTFSPRGHSRREIRPERPSWEPSLMSPSSRSGNRLSTFPALASLLQSPSLNLPGRHESLLRQHHRQLSHDAPHHHRNVSRDSDQHQRHLSHESPRGFSSAPTRFEPPFAGARAEDDPAWEKYRRSMTRDSESRSKADLLSIERLAPQREEQTLVRVEASTELAAVVNSTDHVTSGDQAQSKAENGTESKRAADMQMDHEVKLNKRGSPMLSNHLALRDDFVELPSGEGAADSRLNGDETLLPSSSRDLSEDAQARKPRSRASSLAQSTTTDVSGSQDGNRGHHRQGKDRPHHLGKTSKAERNGLSRKAHKEAKRLHKRTSNNTRGGTEGGSQMFRFRLNTMDTSKPNQIASRTPMATPHTAHHGLEPPYPPLPSYNQPPPPSGFPAPYGPYSSHYYPPDSYYHRNSVPGAGAGAPPHPLWSHAPPAPGYGPPHGPSSMGPPPDHWPAGTPPQPNSQQPPAPPNSAPFGSKYGGPAIAPAVPDPRFPYATGGPPGGNHPPAFAQQQRNSEGNGSRRRTQSDAPRQTKFHHYAGPRNR